MSFSMFSSISSNVGGVRNNLNKVSYVPTAPTDIKVSNTKTSVALVWNSPSYTGNSAIISYDVQYSSDNGSTWFSSSTNTTSTIINNLISNTTYLFQIRANNGDGSGNWSSSMSCRVGIINGASFSETLMYCNCSYANEFGHIYMTNYGNKVYKSINYGISFDVIILNILVDGYFLYFTNNSAITSIGNKVVVASNGYGTVKSSDGGSTWTFNGNYGISVGPGALLFNSTDIFLTTNGQSYYKGLFNSSPMTQIADPTIPTNTFVACGTSDLSTVYVGGNGVIYKYSGIPSTTNLTSTISSAGLGGTVSSIRGIACSTDGIIIYVCSNMNGNIYKSTNSGVSYNILSNSYAPNSNWGEWWSSLDCSSDGSIVVASVYNKYIYYSINGGANWSNYSKVSQWSDVSIFKDGSKIIAHVGSLAYIGT
jgi:hypothetical protein